MDQGVFGSRAASKYPIRPMPGTIMLSDGFTGYLIAATYSVDNTQFIQIFTDRVLTEY